MGKAKRITFGQGVDAAVTTLKTCPIGTGYVGGKCHYPVKSRPICTKGFTKGCEKISGKHYADCPTKYKVASDKTKCTRPPVSASK
jgi:hypothetical protein